MQSKPKFGLPSEIKYCVKCNVINQRPTSTNEYLHDKSTKQIPIDFDKDNICYACKSVDKKWSEEIDWKEREKELIENPWGEWNEKKIKEIMALEVVDVKTKEKKLIKTLFN